MKMRGEDKVWIDYRARFSEVCDDLNCSSPLQSLVVRASHRLGEKAWRTGSFSKVVEIGAGTGEHLSFMRHQFQPMSRG
jgi:hypothetical protein